MNMVQRQAEPAKPKKLAVLFLLPALRGDTTDQSCRQEHTLCILYLK